MPRKFLYILTILLAALSLTITACETDDDEDATDGGTATGGTATGGGATGGAVTGGAATGGSTAMEYRYIRITDTSGVTSGDSPGADIDAVAVVSASTGASQFATAVEGTSGDGITGNTAAATGEPNAFADWASGDTTNCSTDETADLFVGLGGNGAISLAYANGFVAGDTIQVYEVGNCDSTSTDGVRAQPETISIEVAVTGDIATAAWVTATQTATGSPLITATVP